MTNDEIFQKTREILRINIHEGYSKYLNQNYSYIQPSHVNYKFQFFWDTCIHIIILTVLGDYEMAKKNIKSLFAMQEENGFIGHMIFWKQGPPLHILDALQAKPRWNQIRPHMSAIIQPPLAAQAVYKIYEGTKDRQFLFEMLPKLKKYFSWLENNRNFEGDGLLSIISPFESGMDWKPSYDEMLKFKDVQANYKLYWKVIWVEARNFFNRYNLKKIYQKNYFILKETGFNVIYIYNLKCLAKLCEAADDADAKKYSALHNSLTQKLIDISYDEKDKAFYDVRGKEYKKVRTLTPTIYFPIVLDNVPDRICTGLIQNHLLNKEEFNVQFPIPSLAVNHPSFNPYHSPYLWRGPTWIFYNWFLYHALLRRGFSEHSQVLLNSVKEIINKSGFREYYNPFTGEGYGATDFTWSGLVVDMIQGKEWI